MSVSASKHYLHNCLRSQTARLRLAFVLALLSAILMIGQNVLLAFLFADWLHGKDILSVVWYFLSGILICWLCRSLLDYCKQRQLRQVSLLVRSEVRHQLVKKLTLLGPARQHFGNDGALSSLLLDQVDALDGYIVHYITQQKMVVLIPLLIAVVVWIFSPLAALLLLLTAPLVPLFMVLVGEAAARKNRAQFVALARLSGRFLDLLRGLPTLRRLGAVSQAQKAIDMAAQNYRWRTMQVLKLAFLSTAILELFSALAIALVAVYLGLGLVGVLPWATGQIPVPYLGALLILLLAPEFYAPLRQLGADYHDKAKAEAAIIELLPLLQAKPLQQGGTIQNILVQAPQLILDQVSITDEIGRIRLPATSLIIQNAERICLKGKSGSGKSSLLQALLGFVPFSGDIKLNNQDYQQLDLAFLRQFIVYLAQTPPLLPVTIAENLRLAKAEATNKELEQVLTAVGLWSLIAQLPHQLDTALGERGLGLSGGQLQRLALAQILLRNAPFWLLDEPTAHLDTQTANEIMILLEKLSRGKTVILVCHDATTTQWVDRTIYLI